MPAVPDWSAPTQFDLTSPFANLSFNVLTTVDGMPCRFLLDMANCSFEITVRETSDNVPQSDGGILHHRFLTKTSMQLSILLWDDQDKTACDELLAAMVDVLSGAFRSLLNAGDNEGRLAWEIAGGNTRMLDDIRLLVYPAYTEATDAKVITVTIDSQYPYAQDLTQQTVSIAAGASAVITNTGTAAYFPVFKVYGPAAGFTISLGVDRELVFINSIGGGDYVEIDTFRNTMFLNGSGADQLSGLDVTNSVFPVLEPGANTVMMFDADADVLWAPAYG